MAHRVEKRVLVPERVRRLRDGFSWIDRRFVREGRIERLEQAEILLYFFLVAVADARGLSYWGDARTAALLRLTPAQLARARRGLVAQDLVAFDAPLYQVLDLPHESKARRSGMASLGDVLRSLASREEGGHDA
jgi:hypothetical protein